MHFSLQFKTGSKWKKRWTEGQGFFSGMCECAYSGQDFLFGYCITIDYFTNVEVTLTL